ncbi:hypothetical protein D3A87_18310 [Vibrio cholerae]|nr:hypothetical protein [Vibrio cholerae]
MRCQPLSRALCQLGGIMKPIFTIHVGEYLVGSYLENEFGKEINVWIPSKDTGVDFLLTDSSNQKTTSIQVKFSRDFLITNGTDLQQKELLSCGWWTLNREKIESSKAEFWVFVVNTFNEKNMQFIVIQTDELLRRINLIHPDAKKFQTYLWVTKDEKCWEVRGLKISEQNRILNKEESISEERDFSSFLNNWEPLRKKLA